MQSLWNRMIYWLLIPSFLLIMILGFEIYQNRMLFTIDSNKIGMTIIPVNNLSGIQLIDGKPTISYVQPDITIRVQMGYIDKLNIKADVKQITNYTLTASKKLEDGSTKEMTTEGIIFPQIGEDTLIVRQDCDQIVLSFEDTPVTILSLSVMNYFRFNFARMLFMSVAAISLYLMVLLRKTIARKLEIGFAIVAIASGLLLSSFLPVDSLISWDDEIHFKRANMMSFLLSETPITAAADSINQEKWRRWNDAISFSSPFSALEDQFSYFKAISAMDDIDNPASTAEYQLAWTDVGYVTQALMIGLARILGLPFFLQFILGRIGNLLLYVVICYYAIKHAVRFKVAMTTIALMPVPIFLASSYSYDTTVTSFCFLGISLIITELLTPQVQLVWQRATVILLTLVIGSFPKAIYIPILLLLLMLPVSKFKSKKQAWLFKNGVCVVFILMMATFVLPTIMHPQTTGDLRGGDTSVSRQLNFIIGNVFSYIKMFIRTFWSNFITYFINNSRISWAYLGYPHANVSFLSLIIVTLGIYSDSEPEIGSLLALKQKMWIFICCVAIIAMVFTAMYLSFTPVGYNDINGVQGRYFIPLFPLLAMIIQPNGIKNTMNRVRYHLTILVANSVVLYFMIYDMVIMRFWQ